MRADVQWFYRYRLIQFAHTDMTNIHTYTSGTAFSKRNLKIDNELLVICVYLSMRIWSADQSFVNEISLSVDYSTEFEWLLLWFLHFKFEFTQRRNQPPSSDGNNNYSSIMKKPVALLSWHRSIHLCHVIPMMLVKFLFHSFARVNCARHQTSNAKSPVLKCRPVVAFCLWMGHAAHSRIGRRAWRSIHRPHLILCIFISS